MTQRHQNTFDGFGQFVGTFVIGTGASGTACSAVDLGRPYAYLVIKCEDCSHIPAGTTIIAKVGETDDDTLCSLKELGDPNTAWNKSVPSTGTFRTVLREAFGAQRIKFELSAPTTGGTATITIIGVAAGLDK